MAHERVDCCICGKHNLSTVEGDGGTECQMSDGSWVCSSDCYDEALLRKLHTETQSDENR